MDYQKHKIYGSKVMSLMDTVKKLQERYMVLGKELKKVEDTLWSKVGGDTLILTKRILGLPVRKKPVKLALERYWSHTYNLYMYRFYCLYHKGAMKSITNKLNLKFKEELLELSWLNHDYTTLHRLVGGKYMPALIQLLALEQYGLTYEEDKARLAEIYRIVCSIQANLKLKEKC